MSREIKIFDTTLRDGEQSPGAAMSEDQKVEMAFTLERLGVDRIEAGFPVSSPVQFNAVKRIADMLDFAAVVALARSVDVDLSVHCHNDLGLAVANSIAAIQNGANQVEVTLNGIGERAGNCSLEEFVMALNVRKDLLDYHTNIKTNLLYPTSKLLQNITGLIIPRNKPIFGDNAFAHESGIHQDGVIKHKETYEIMKPETIGRSLESLVLGRHSGTHAFKKKLEQYGIVLPETLWAG